MAKPIDLYGKADFLNHLASESSLIFRLRAAHTKFIIRKTKRFAFP